MFSWKEWKRRNAYRNARDTDLGGPSISLNTVKSIRERLLVMADDFQVGPVFQLLMDAVDVIDWMDHRLEPRVWEEN